VKFDKLNAFLEQFRFMHIHHNAIFIQLCCHAFLHLCVGMQLLCKFSSMHFKCIFGVSFMQFHCCAIIIQFRQDAFYEFSWLYRKMNFCCSEIFVRFMLHFWIVLILCIIEAMDFYAFLFRAIFMQILCTLNAFLEQRIFMHVYHNAIFMLFWYIT